MSVPGDESRPEDTRGDGTVELSDRTEPGGQGSPDTNQGKPEPGPAAEHEADPRAERPAPQLSDMTVGSADPQSPSHPAARDTGGVDPGRGAAGPGDPAGVAVPSTEPAPGTSEGQSGVLPG